MSALPPKADIVQRTGDVRFGPITDMLFKRIREFVRQKIPAQGRGLVFSFFCAVPTVEHITRFSLGCAHNASGISMLPAADHAGNRRAEDGRQPEQPELRDIGSAGKQRRAGASRRIDRGIGDRDQEEMNKRQAKPDGYAGKSDRRAFRGGADDDVQEEEGRDDFNQEARRQTVFSGAEIAVAVGRKPTGNPVRVCPKRSHRVPPPPRWRRPPVRGCRGERRWP